MVKKLSLVFVVLTFSFLVLTVSILKASAIHYDYSQPPNFEPDRDASDKLVYDITFNSYYHGNVLPDNPLWNLKVVRDRLWILVTTDPAKRSELYLMLADKRLGAASYLFLNKKTDLGISVLTKAEKYLEASVDCEQEAKRENKINSLDLVYKISSASLFHRQIIEDIMNVTTEQAKPMVVLSLDYPKRIYRETSSYLVAGGMRPIPNPFE